MKENIKHLENKISKIKEHLLQFRKDKEAIRGLKKNISELERIKKYLNRKNKNK